VVDIRRVKSSIVRKYFQTFNVNWESQPEIISVSILCNFQFARVNTWVRSSAVLFGFMRCMY
jgi:hypothetical protein